MPLCANQFKLVNNKVRTPSNNLLNAETAVFLAQMSAVSKGYARGVWQYSVSTNNICTESEALYTEYAYKASILAPNAVDYHSANERTAHSIRSNFRCLNLNQIRGLKLIADI